MDSDNSNRKTSYFHAQKILDAAADIKTKKSRGVRTEEIQNDPIYLKIRVYSEKKSHVLIYSIGLYTKWSTSSVRQHFMYLLVHYVVLISKYLDLLISKSLQFFF